MKERDILIAFDGSEHALKAVEYVGSQFSGLKDIKVTLFYATPSVPPQFWDDGHILTPAEKEERQGVIDRWFSNQKMVLEPLFEKARRILAEKGMDPEQVETRMAGDAAGVAEAILEEANSGRYRTLVLGRHGAVPVLAGGLAITILHKGAGLAICIVE
ncbi:MAG TPA: universal stress protein [Syntrophorhabdaceae bacterium]|nr:universal stress protein [Syntrophorhabdaceae bacterium]